jgi:hypothetical protein
MNHGFFPGIHPPAEFVAHRTALIEMTVLRAGIVRAKASGKPTSKSEDLACEMKHMYNGDYRELCVQHYCVDDCCQHQNRAVTVQRLYALSLDAVFTRIGFVAEVFQINTHRSNC